MLKEIRPAILILLLLTAITGVAYPLAMTAVAGAIFPKQAQGSLIEKDGKVVGSALIGQEFKDDKYFHGRLSAIIFNALIIIALIPLALKGVAYRAVGAGALLRRNLLIYGLGGIIVPFIGIKAIDLVVAALHLA